MSRLPRSHAFEPNAVPDRPLDPDDPLPTV